MAPMMASTITTGINIANMMAASIRTAMSRCPKVAGVPAMPIAGGGADGKSLM